jgi:DNA-binding transcriptional ArsR family regulator
MICGFSRDSLCFLDHAEGMRFVLRADAGLGISASHISTQNVPESCTIRHRIASQSNRPQFRKLAYLSIDLIKKWVYYRPMDAFNALADPTRRSIIELLARRGHLPVSEIAEQYSVSAPAISQHLKVLREARLVQVEKHAQQRIYRLNPETMREMEQWVRGIREQWDERFDALDRVLAAEMAKETDHTEDASASQED